MSDSELVEAIRRGDWNAFRQIVGRYQSLVCALTYSVCGNAAQSEDMAQETFLVAWRDLGDLRDAAKLKSWLAGIARNVARNARRGDVRRERRVTTDQDAVIDGRSDEPTPDEMVASREEEAIVWQALAGIPENYREPMVLFYREERSVRSVAEAMGLSEDAVKQRLSRAREMLRDRVEEVLERSLRRRKPSSALTLAVMAAIPALATQAKAAAVAGAAMKGLPATKAAVGTAALWSLAGPVIGLAATPLFTGWMKRNIKSPRQRHFMVRYAWGFSIMLFVLGVIVALVSSNTALMRSRPVLYGVLLGGAIIGMVAATVGVSLWASRRLKRIQEEDRKCGE